MEASSERLTRSRESDKGGEKEGRRHVVPNTTVHTAQHARPEREESFEPEYPDRDREGVGLGLRSPIAKTVFATQPICSMKLVHLERRSVDNQIIVSQSVITALFRRFAGPKPTIPHKQHRPSIPQPLIMNEPRVSSSWT
jgi:hypothetical protein